MACSEALFLFWLYARPSLYKLSYLIVTLGCIINRIYSEFVDV